MASGRVFFGGPKPTARQSASQIAPMIVGNRNAGKRMAVAAIAMLIMMFIITLLVGMRKKTDPTQKPPLHPSVLVV
jgi:hypothetical protein